MSNDTTGKFVLSTEFCDNYPLDYSGKMDFECSPLAHRDSTAQVTVPYTYPSHMMMISMPQEKMMPIVASQSDATICVENTHIGDGMLHPFDQHRSQPQPLLCDIVSSMSLSPEQHQQSTTGLNSEVKTSNPNVPVSVWPCSSATPVPAQATLLATAAFHGNQPTCARTPVPVPSPPLPSPSSPFESSSPTCTGGQTHHPQGPTRPHQDTITPSTSDSVSTVVLETNSPMEDSEQNPTAAWDQGNNHPSPSLQHNTTVTLSSSELRRQIHIQSEQKRRAQIKDGFDELRNELPHCLNKKMSKVALLQQTVQHIKHLKETQLSILAELERLTNENKQLKKFQKQALEKMYQINNL